MATKTVYNVLDASQETAHESPLEEGVFHYPSGTVETAPPSFDSDTQVCSWNGSEWVISTKPEENPEVPAPPLPPVSEPEAAPPDPVIEYDERGRRLDTSGDEPEGEKTWLEHRQEEYGSGDEQIEYITENGLDAWVEKVNAIKAKYPKPS